jgi:hypothetical protein
LQHSCDTQAKCYDNLSKTLESLDDLESTEFIIVEAHKVCYQLATDMLPTNTLSTATDMLLTRCQHAAKMLTHFPDPYVCAEALANTLQHSPTPRNSASTPQHSPTLLTHTPQLRNTVRWIFGLLLGVHPSSPHSITQHQDSITQHQDSITQNQDSITQHQDSITQQWNPS